MCACVRVCLRARACVCDGEWGGRVRCHMSSLSKTGFFLIDPEALHFSSLDGHRASRIHLTLSPEAEVSGIYRNAWLST